MGGIGAREPPTAAVTMFVMVGLSLDAESERSGGACCHEADQRQRFARRLLLDRRYSRPSSVRVISLPSIIARRISAWSPKRWLSRMIPLISISL